MPAWNAAPVQEIALLRHSKFVPAWAAPPQSSTPCWAGKNPPAAARSTPKVKSRDQVLLYKPCINQWVEDIDEIEKVGLQAAVFIRSGLRWIERR